jgi:hypothetical protein
MRGMFKMSSLKVPPFFHELFGKRITRLELWLTLLFTVGMTIFLLTSTYHEWQMLAFWKIILLVTLTIDVTGGVIANFSHSTNSYYHNSSKKRLVFIAIHVQPIIFAWLYGNHYSISLFVWVYTVVAAWIVQALIIHPCQRVIGAFLTVSGVSLFLLLATEVLPIFLLTIFAFYMVKVIFSFSVDHYAKRAE